ncbi:MAG: hypothetical protein OEQ74_04090 [Gammaproteobacteria bacterium]|nr:hypothetical protein [Gammaproteobacteria bacterium]
MICLARLLVASALLVVTACAGTMHVPLSSTDTKLWSDSAQHDRDKMVGKWLGESDSGDGKLRLTLVERRENGTYTLTFRTYEGHNYEEAVEVGLWGISGPVYFTIMRGWMTGGRFAPSDTTRAYYYDAYKIIQLDNATFEYQSVETGNRFVNRRVGDDFQFSD